MTMAARGRRVYPARRAVEHATSLTGVHPLRLFPVLWPLWQVETTASFYDERAYEVVDRFLVRAVSEAGLCRVDELAAFYGIPAALVQRCLRFLTTIGHVDQDGETVSLTALGQRSAQAGIRYEPKESRQEILIEQFTGQPLPRRYYEGSVPVFTSTEVPEDRLADRSRFMPLFAAAVFRPELVERLAERSDRAELNVPQHLRDLRVVGERPAFMPVYLIETAGRDLLAYTALAAERDAFFEAACRQAPAIGHMISAEEKADPLQIWTEWLAESQAGQGTLRQLPNQVWRATLRADVFGPGGRLPLSRLGSYELRRRHFLQLWCQDAGLRRSAVMERALSMTSSSDVTSQADLRKRIAALARQLEIAEPSVADLRQYGTKHRLHASVARMDALE
jgi:hypothetical protein